ncbi:MAG TPA: mechanosensitive ion channel family protein, partial [Minicystis sp.]|nr:mechanosensitive ion channel family protein [Minicystis sp.]
AAQLAVRLHAVLDREARLRLDRISGASDGDTADRLPAGVDEIAVVMGRTGPEPVRLVKRALPDGTRWLFSRATVEKVDGWFGRLEGRWIEQELPKPLLREGPDDVLVWQWIALPTLLAAAWAAARIAAYAVGRLLTKLTARADVPWMETLHARLAAPVAFAFALATVYVALPYFGVSSAGVAFLDRALVAGGLLAFFWLLLRAVDVLGARLVARAETRANAAARSLVPLGAKATKIVVVAMAVIAALSELGYPVASLIAGLGIGGVALALAAQKTVENLFGSVSIGVDQPFRVGDFVRVDGVLGAVESIGLRSTRLRTPERTRVTIPNGKLADMRVECISDRDKILFSCTLPLDLATPAEAVGRARDGVEAALRAHPKTHPDGVSVSLARVSATSLDVEASAYVATTDFDVYVAARQELLLASLAALATAGAALAVPVQTVRLERDAAR